MRVGSIYTLPPVAATTAGGLRVTIGFEEPFLVEEFERNVYRIRAARITDRIELLDAVFYVDATQLGASYFRACRIRRRPQCLAGRTGKKPRQRGAQ